MYYKNRPSRPLKPAPARDLAHAAVLRVLGEGRCVLSTEELALVSGISQTTARKYLVAAAAAGLFRELREIVPIARQGLFVMTERFPGAPAEDLIRMNAVIAIAAGPKSFITAAFGYHTALELHGLTEVTSAGLYVVKIRRSVHPPKLPGDTTYEPKPRMPQEWTRVENRPVWVTLRSPAQLPDIDLVSVPRDQMHIPATNPLRTLVDAWMHPDWCGGEDRVADSWTRYWSQASLSSSRADLVSMLISTAWPGMWKPLATWATAVVPALSGLQDQLDQAVHRV